MRPNDLANRRPRAGAKPRTRDVRVERRVRRRSLGKTNFGAADHGFATMAQRVERIDFTSRCKEAPRRLGKLSRKSAPPTDTNSRHRSQPIQPRLLLRRAQRAPYTAH